MTEQAGNRLTERRWMNPEQEVKNERGSRNPQMWHEIKGDGEMTGTEGREET